MSPLGWERSKEADIKKKQSGELDTVTEENLWMCLLFKYLYYASTRQINKPNVHIDQHHPLHIDGDLSNCETRAEEVARSLETLASAVWVWAL